MQLVQVRKQLGWKRDDMWVMSNYSTLIVDSDKIISIIVGEVHDEKEDKPFHILLTCINDEVYEIAKFVNEEQVVRAVMDFMMSLKKNTAFMYKFKSTYDEDFSVDILGG